MGLLRLFLAVSVVVGHTSLFLGVNFFVAGSIAVEAFFIISGFYMSLILNEKYVGKKSYRLFITNRLLKLYPIYWVVLLVSIFFSFCIPMFQDIGIEQFSSHFKEFGISEWLFAITSNLFVFGQDVAMYLELNNGNLELTRNFAATEVPFWRFLFVPPAWSLGIELLFYVIAPFVVRKKNTVLVPLIIFSFGTKLFIIHYLGWDNDPWTYRFFPSELGYFLLGTISYNLYKRLDRNRPQNINEIGYIMSIVVIVLTLIYNLIPITEIAGISILPIDSNSIKKIIYMSVLVISIPFVFEYTKKNKIDRFLGELSFPIYISHWLVISLYNWFNKEETYDVTYYSLHIILLTVLVSVFLNRFVLNPVEKYRQNRVGRSSKNESIENYIEKKQVV